MAEPTATAALLLVTGVLLALSTLFSRAATPAGVPLALLFIVVGMAAGAEGLGGIAFADHAFAFRLGAAALVLILFDGGLNTSPPSARAVLAPSALLATAGVMATAGLVAVAARALAFSWGEALVLGAIVSSTDAALVFAVLRGSGVHLKRRVGLTLELESGLNDPMAVILTVAFTESLSRGVPIGPSLLLQVAIQMVIGLAVGLGVGGLGALLIARVRLPAGGLYPVLTLSLGFVAFGLATLLFGSGFLAVFVAGIVVGNRALPNRSGLMRVHDALAWLSQVVMFLVLGLLASPSRLLSVAWTGLAITAFLALVGRPLSVLACLLPFRYPARELLYIGWVGLRGAVPIFLATIPVLAGASNAQRIFDVVFFIVVFSALLPGATVRALTRRLGLVSTAPPPPHAVLEVNSTRPLEGELASFYVRAPSAAKGAAISELPFPQTASAMLLVRGSELIAPKGATVLEEGDHLYVFCKREDLPLLQLLFGAREED